jgi:hypothetical protein
MSQIKNYISYLLLSIIILIFLFGIIELFSSFVLYVYGKGKFSFETVTQLIIKNINREKFRELDIDFANLSHENILDLEGYKNLEWVIGWSENQSMPSLVYSPFTLWNIEPNFNSKFINTTINGTRYTPSYKMCTNYDKNDSNLLENINIYIHGGSTIYGDGILRDEDLIPFHLKCRALDDNRNFLIKNFGQSGYNISNDLIVFSNLIRSGELPDMFIFYFGFNDVMHKVIKNQEHMGQFEFENSISFFKKNNLRHSGVPSKDQINMRLNNLMSETVQSFKYIDRLSNAYGFNYLFILQPTIFDDINLHEDDLNLKETIKKEYPFIYNSIKSYRELINEYKSSNNFKNLEIIRSCFPNKNQKWVDIVHLTPGGNEMISNCIYDLIVDHL